VLDCSVLPVSASVQQQPTADIPRHHYTMAAELT
jgi:hypothetical protein